jgi:sirohydrochlorin ferrochelatase
MVFSSIKMPAVSPSILLFDNGSLRAEPTVRLRSIASTLSRRLDRPVFPTSLLHSNNVDPVQLGGFPARLLEVEIVRQIDRGETDFTLLPFFIGPGNAFTDTLPNRLRRLREHCPTLNTRTADTLARLGSHLDLRLAEILVARIIATLGTLDMISPPAVVVVDHGSPVCSLARIRDQIALEVGRLLGKRVAGVQSASMEKRAGQDYDFNDPLLEIALGQAVNANRTVVVGLLFLAPGRHAGPGGDVEEICRKIERHSPGAQIRMTESAGLHPGIVDILVDRVREVER